MQTAHSNAHYLVTFYTHVREIFSLQIKCVWGHSAFIILAQLLLAPGEDSFPGPSCEVLVHPKLVPMVIAAGIQIMHENRQIRFSLYSVFISMQDYKLWNISP